MKIGAHVPTGGSLLSAIAAARRCGAEAVQIFASNPRAWAPPRIAASLAADFRAAWREAGLGPLFVHAPYLVNIASPSPELHRRSADLAAATLEAAESLGARGLVVHAGAGGRGEPERARDRAVRSLLSLAERAGDTSVVVELTAGGAGSVAATFPDAARLVRGADGHPRLVLCADTCHLFAAGYALDTAEGVRRCFDELGRLGLTRRLVLVHANDARFPRGSRRDRHEHVGRGNIGRGGFAAILSHPAVRRCAVICETPGGLEDHRRNVETLRELAPDPPRPGEGMSPARSGS